MQEQLKFSDLFKNMKKHLIRTIVLTLVIFIVAFSGLCFLSKNNNYYESKFQLYWTGLEQEKLPNGKSFDYRDIISLSNLKAVKDSDEAFKNIDVDKMYHDDDIDISKNYVLKNENDKLSGYIYNYKITVKESYFDNKGDAAAFVKELIDSTTYDVAYQQIVNYSIPNYFENMNEETEYTEIVNQMAQQVKLNNTVLDAFILEHSGKQVYDFEKNKTIADLKAEFDSFLKNNDYNYFAYEIKEKNYVRNLETAKETLTKRKKVVESRIEKNQLQIDALNSIMSGSASIETNDIPMTLKKLVLENVDLNYELQYLNTAIVSATYNDEFNLEVNEFLDNLMMYKNEIEKAYKAINNETLTLRYDTNKIVVRRGRGFTTNLIFSIGGTVFVMFAVIFITTYYDHKKGITTVTDK